MKPSKKTTDRDVSFRGCSAILNAASHACAIAGVVVARSWGSLGVVESFSAPAGRFTNSNRVTSVSEILRV